FYTSLSLSLSLSLSAVKTEYARPSNAKWGRSAKYKGSGWVTATFSAISPKRPTRRFMALSAGACKRYYDRNKRVTAEHLLY
ncbi:MAG: hypothetical protein ACI9A1_001607, partial [Lentimonas sp.]